MKANYCTFDQILEAIAVINKKYDGNVRINPDSTGTKKFTLRPVNSAGAGASFKRGRRINACCWHVHGDFFDALLAINPQTVITSAKSKIDINGGNWIDYNVGSIMFPEAASNCCKC